MGEMAVADDEYSVLPPVWRPSNIGHASLAQTAMRLEAQVAQLVGERDAADQLWVEVLRQHQFVDARVNAATGALEGVCTCMEPARLPAALSWIARLEWGIGWLEHVACVVRARREEQK